jgi:hypothetical protein
VEFESYCYQVRRNATHWIGAENDCTSTGSHLASIHSRAENDFIYDLEPVASGYKNLFWLGGSDYASQVKQHSWAQNSYFVTRYHYLLVAVLESMSNN